MCQPAHLGKCFEQNGLPGLAQQQDIMRGPLSNPNRDKSDAGRNKSTESLGCRAPAIQKRHRQLPPLHSAAWGTRAAVATYAWLAGAGSSWITPPGAAKARPKISHPADS